MKKTFIALAIVAFAVAAQATTVKWSIGGAVTFVMNDVNGNPYASQNVYLILASESDLATITRPDTLDKAGFYDALSALTVASTTSSETGTKPTDMANTEVQSSLMTVGIAQTFGALIVSEDSQFGYYKVLTASASSYADDAPATARSGNVRTAWNTLSNQSWTKAYSVPEPSLAAMALLGLGMMLKRRKA